MLRARKAKKTALAFASLCRFPDFAVLMLLSTALLLS